MAKIVTIIPAGGTGKRMGKPVPKQLLELMGKPIISHTLARFQSCDLIDQIILIVPHSFVKHFKELVKESGFSKVQSIINGGRARQDSVRNGLNALPADTDYVLIHDAVRPFISIQKIDEVIRQMKKYGAAILAVPVKDTIKKGQGDWVSETLDRDVLWQVQTPQGFRSDWLREAYRKAESDKIQATDDAALVEWLGHRIKIVQGDPGNIKITSPVDLAWAEMMLRKEAE